MATDADRLYLSKLRSRHAEAATHWSLDATGQCLVAVIVENTEPVTIAKLMVDCGFVDSEFLRHAHDDVRFLLRLLDEAFVRLRGAQGNQQTPAPDERDRGSRKNGGMAANCAMLCGDGLFSRYLTERHDLPAGADKSAIETRVRFVLNITSRGEIDSDERARAAWIDLRADFNKWRNHP